MSKMSKMYAVKASRRRTASVTPVSAGADRPGRRAAVFFFAPFLPEGGRGAAGAVPLLGKKQKREKSPLCCFSHGRPGQSPCSCTALRGRNMDFTDVAGESGKGLPEPFCGLKSHMFQPEPVNSSAAFPCARPDAEVGPGLISANGRSCRLFFCSLKGKSFINKTDKFFKKRKNFSFFVTFFTFFNSNYFCFILQIL